MTPEEAKPLKVDKGYIVTVTVKPGMPVGDFHEELVIQTDHPKQPEIKITVGGNTFGPISVTPERVRMIDVVEPQGGVARRDARRPQRHRGRNSRWPRSRSAGSGRRAG